MERKAPIPRLPSRSSLFVLFFLSSSRTNRRYASGHFLPHSWENISFFFFFFLWRKGQQLINNDVTTLSSCKVGQKYLFGCYVSRERREFYPYDHSATKPKLVTLRRRERIYAKPSAVHAVSAERKIEPPPRSVFLELNQTSVTTPFENNISSQRTAWGPRRIAPRSVGGYT